MRILLYQTAFLGDLILTTPLIESIKSLFPESNLTVITKPFGKDVLKNNPYVDNLIIFDKSRDSTIGVIKKLYNKFDVAISPHRSHRASYILFLSKIPKRIGFDKAGFSFLYTDTVPHRFDGTHDIDRNLSLLKVFPEYSEEKIKRIPSIYLSEEEDEFYKKFNLTSKDYIVIAPGSKWKTKRWTAKGFFEVAKKLSEDFKVVFIGSSEDRDFMDKILSFGKLKIEDLIGKTALRESFSIIKHSKLLISNDSSPVHMAVAFNTPVIDIYGPTVKDFGFYPYRNGVVIEVNGLNCRPCGLHGHNRCPLGTHECMEKINPQEVLKEAYRLVTLSTF
ncbi:MAG: glycosyltransferase family 9 protein [Hydrogenothermaceae bacterium]|nr:glycosyltransferase family 9 protein [Hydrogenothermaceae bacterium]